MRAQCGLEASISKKIIVDTESTYPMSLAMSYLFPNTCFMSNDILGYKLSWQNCLFFIGLIFFMLLSQLKN